MITPSFALTATERVLPRMALDFTTATLDSRVTFTRTGNIATRVNSLGLIETIGANLPRFDYDPTTLVCKGLLIEESRTNLLLRSSEFDNVGWGKSLGVTVTANTDIAPDGTLTADTVNFSGSNLVLNQFPSATGSVSGSIYMKGTAGETILFSVGSQNTTMTLSGNWQRFTINNVTVAGAFSFQLSTFLGVTARSIKLWGAQAEVGSFSTSFIPTDVSQVTRNPDVAVMTSTNFSNWYTATTGAAVVWAIPQTATGTRPLLQFDDTTANEIIVLGGNVANPEMSIVDGGVAQAQIDTGTIVANTAYKLSGAWNTNSCAAAQNGAAAVTDNTATIPTPTQLRIGSDGTNYASAWVQKVLYYPQRLINAEVQAFSK